MIADAAAIAVTRDRRLRDFDIFDAFHNEMYAHVVHPVRNGGIRGQVIRWIKFIFWSFRGDIRHFCVVLFRYSSHERFSGAFPKHRFIAFKIGFCISKADTLPEKHLPVAAAQQLLAARIISVSFCVRHRCASPRKLLLRREAQIHDRNQQQR